MKDTSHLFYSLKSIASIFILFSIISCVNSIDTESEDEESIPIALATRIQQDEAASSLTGFEEDAEIGVYIISANSTLSGQRHIDNTKFTYSNNNGFQPVQTVFFPEDNSKCKFLAYYPYQETGIECNKSTMEISIQTDQREQEAFNQSDFLTAVSDNISPVSDPVNLVFKHTLHRINIRLKPDLGYTIEQLLATNPEVIIKNIYTKAIYDFDQNSFTSQNTSENLQAYGEWEIADGMLTGKSIIIIPQEIPAGHPFIEIRTNSLDYQYNTTTSYKFTQGDAQNLTITLSPNNETLKCTLETSIQGWGTQEEKEITANEIDSYIKTDDLNFTNSNVYEVVNRGNKVAEICMEYLVNGNINAQAIVIYPVKDGKAELTSGLVLKVLGETTNKHGGSVSWNVDNELNYSAGNSPVIDYIYISSDGQIKTTRPENTLQIQLRPVICEDIRGTENITYPVVKIGTQYWMRNNLKATKYTNGMEIYKSDDFTDLSAKFFVNGTHYFYNSEAIKTGMLNPQGWRIANSSDWEQLEAYIQGDASVLKKEENWDISSGFAATNLAGFSAIVTGYYDKEYVNSKRVAFYWSTNISNPTEVENIMYLSIEKNTITKRGIATYGLSVRCLRND